MNTKQPGRTTIEIDREIKDRLLAVSKAYGSTLGAAHNKLLVWFLSLSESDLDAIMSSRIDRLPSPTGWKHPPIQLAHPDNTHKVVEVLEPDGHAAPRAKRG